jgi:hypothetical protein
MIRHLHTRVRDMGLLNVSPVLARPDDPGIRPGHSSCPHPARSRRWRLSNGYQAANHP